MHSCLVLPCSALRVRIDYQDVMEKLWGLHQTLATLFECLGKLAHNGRYSIDGRCGQLSRRVWVLGDRDAGDTFAVVWQARH